MTDGKPYKIRNTMQYTEVFYYDGAGNLVDTERHQDDHTYDSAPPEPLSQQEIDDWVPSYNEPSEWEEGDDDDDGIDACEGV